MDECQLNSALLELKLFWKVEKVSLDPEKKMVEIYIAYEKGSRLSCPVCIKECMVYDHLHERILRDLYSIEFTKFINANLTRISFLEHGIREVSCHGFRRNQYMDTFNFTEIMKLSWKQAWNIIERSVKREGRKIGHPSIIGIDEKLYSKGHR